MKAKWQIFLVMVVFIALVANLFNPSEAISLERVLSVARQTTVVVAQDLKKGDNQALKEAFHPGSGVLIGNKDDAYYVATNYHVVSARGTDYGVRTPDGIVHFVEDEDTNDNIDSFGKYLQNRIQGSDLAIVRFKADQGQQYPVAKINLTRLEQEPVFVAGWPDPGPQFPAREFRVSSGILNSLLKVSEDGDYNMQYSAATRRGMSGGPVFNFRGELIAIHGRGGGKNLAEYGEPDRDCLDTRKCFNRGIAINIFTTRLKENPRYAQLLANSSAIEPDQLAKRPVPGTATRIKDIYREFRSELDKTTEQVNKIEERLKKLENR